MEISTACSSRLVSPPHARLFPTFFDLSHLDFYQRRTSSLPSISLRPPPLRSQSSLGPLHAICQSGCPPPLLEPVADPNSLMKELAELKQRMKLKKKELKSQKKEEKKKLKMQTKEEKRALKNDCAAGKKKCKSESSSSSESSDEGCKSMSMKTLREERVLPCASSIISTRFEAKGNDMSSQEKDLDQVSTEIVAETVPLAYASPEIVAETIPLAYASIESQVFAVSKTDRFIGKAELPMTLTLSREERVGLRTQRSMPSLSGTQAPNRVEVCTGGKCKKAGSERLLSALNTQIPSSSDVVAVPCKCMGRCAMNMNVRVLKEDTNPQHHSHVRVEDANLILNHHYGLGRPPSGLPVLEPCDWTRVPVSGTV